MATAMTKKELAALAGYTYRRLYDIDKTLPEDKKLFVPAEGGGNRYDAAAFVQRWVDYRVHEDGGTDKDLDRVRAEHERIKTRKTELEVAKMEGTVVPIDQVRAEWAKAGGGSREREVRAALVALSEAGEAIAAQAEKEEAPESEGEDE